MSFITVTNFGASPSKHKNNPSVHVIVQNGKPNFISLSPFKYKEYSIATNSKDQQCDISVKSLLKKNHITKSQNTNLNDFSAPNNNNNNGNMNLENESKNDIRTKNICVPNLIDKSHDNDNNDLDEQINKNKRDKNSFKKELKIKLAKAVNSARRSRSVQSSSRKQRPSTSEEHHVVKTFKNISKSNEKVFDNAQKIRYKKTIQNFEKIENYKDKMIVFETEKIIARFSPTKNTEFDSVYMANPILTSTQRSQKQIKYYYCPSHINNTSKIKSFNGSVNYDRGITEAVAEIRKDRLNSNFMFQY